MLGSNPQTETSQPSMVASFGAINSASSVLGVPLIISTGDDRKATIRGLSTTYSVARYLGPSENIPRKHPINSGSAINGVYRFISMLPLSPMLE